MISSILNRVRAFTACHLLGAAGWGGGHLVLSISVPPRARDAGILAATGLTQWRGAGGVAPG